MRHSQHINDFLLRPERILHRRVLRVVVHLRPANHQHADNDRDELADAAALVDAAAGDGDGDGPGEEVVQGVVVVDLVRDLPGGFYQPDELVAGGLAVYLEHYLVFGAVGEVAVDRVEREVDELGGLVLYLDAEEILAQEVDDWFHLVLEGFLEGVLEAFLLHPCLDLRHHTHNLKNLSYPSFVCF